MSWLQMYIIVGSQSQCKDKILTNTSIYTSIRKKGSYPMSIPIDCPWAARGKFAMQIWLTSTSLYRSIGLHTSVVSTQLPTNNCYPLISRYGEWAANKWAVHYFLPIALSTTFQYGNNGEPTELPTVKFKMYASYDLHPRHLQHMCIMHVIANDLKSVITTQIERTYRFEYITL